MSYFSEDATLSGSVPKYQGDSGVVIPENGSEPAEITKDVINEVKKDADNNKNEIVEDAQSSDIQENIDEENKEFYEKTIQKEKYNMNEMLLAFWHGIIAILVGEASALAITVACVNIYKNHHKDNDFCSYGERKEE